MLFKQRLQEKKLYFHFFNRLDKCSEGGMKAMFIVLTLCRNSSYTKIPLICLKFFKNSFDPLTTMMWLVKLK